MMKSAKKGRKPDPKKLAVNTHLGTLHQRLYHALNLAFRYSDGKEREWHTNDVEIQRLVLRSISAFVDGISSEALQNPLVKVYLHTDMTTSQTRCSAIKNFSEDSVPDVIRAIGGILQSQNEAVLAMACAAAVKMISILPSAMFQPHVGHLIHPLSLLLSNHHFQVAVTSATGLNLIISNLSIKKEREAWEILAKAATVAQLISNLRNFCEKVKPIEYFVAMASLLGSIMQSWPSSRYPVWSDATLMEVVEHFCSKPLTDVKTTVLHMYSALALCGYGAKMLLESSGALLQRIVECMGESQPHSVRSLAFRLVQRLMADKNGCTKMLSVSCEAIVKSIISALGYSSKHNERVPDREISLMFEACQLAMVTRWPGKHHAYLWSSRVDRVLLDLLMYNFHNTHLNQQPLSVQELIAVTREGLNADFLLDLRPYIWEMVGWLSAHCKEDFHPKMHGKEPHLDVLITSACLSFMDSIGRKRLIRQADRTYTFRSISAAKATLMMISSPSRYISSQAKLVLFEILKLDGEEHLKHMICFLNFVFFGDTSRMPDEFQMLINLMGLTCYSALPQFYRQVVGNGGVKAILAFVRWWLDNDVHVQKLSLTSHLQNTSKEATCCRNDIEDWEGEESHLLLAVWSLAEMINHHMTDGLEIFTGQAVYGKEQFIKDIQDIFISTRSSGLTAYCSHLLSFFGCYGFPSKLGKKIMLALGDEDQCDMSFILRNGQSVNVHQVVLLARCPSLLPPKDLSDKGKTAESNGSSGRQATDKCQRTKKEVVLSAQVDEQALLKLLDYIYSGHLQAEGDLVRKLKMLAKRCNMHPLLQLLCNKRPMWASSMLSFDLSHALGPAGHDLSDIVLEAKSTEDTRWTCSYCSFSMPHVHAHRVILSASCEYLRALFQSGMQESHSLTLKVPITWEALRKLVTWIYSHITPEPVSGCLWDNMDVEKKITELQPYIELCWLSEFWFLDDFENECLRVITSFLDSPELSVKVIQLAADFSQWILVNIAAKRIAPSYHTMRRSGTLDILDEGLVEMIRVASVRLCQE